MGIVSFNGISTEDLGLIVQTSPVYTFPEKDAETYHVPGKNGDVVIDNNTYKNVERTYNFAAIFKQGDEFAAVARKITAWLNSAKGYARLEDSYEPEFFRYAMYRKNNEMLNYWDQATTINATFECKPQRFLRTGDEFVTLDPTIIVNRGGNELVNPFKFTAKPIFKITTRGAATIHIHHYKDRDDTASDDFIYNITITEAVTDLIIDTELQECYNSSGYKNNIVQLSDYNFPELHEGSTFVSILTEGENNVTSIEIKPRWWTL